MRHLFVGLFCLLTTLPQLAAATFYVDYATGSDAHPGTQSSSPWKHCPGDPAATGTAATQRLVAGDVVLFRGGVTYVLAGATGIVLNASGSAGSPIVFASGSSKGWGSGLARFTDGNGGAAISAFTAATPVHDLEFRSLEFHRIGGAAALPSDNGKPAAPRFGGALAFPHGVENVLITACTFSELGYWSNQRPMAASSLNGVGISAQRARNLKIAKSRFSRVAYAVDLAAASSLADVEVSQSSFGEAIVWPLHLPAGPNAPAATSVRFVDNQSEPDVRFSQGAWGGYGHGPATEVATVTAGASATLYATAIASPAPTYEWRRNGARLVGQTGAVLRLASVSLSDAGVYTAIAANAGGSAASNAAVLTVNASAVPDGVPVILAQPASQIASIGGSVQFEVRFSGAASPSFQWHKNGVPLAGQTRATLSLSNLAASDAAGYSVVVANDFGRITSDPATLVVVDGPLVAVAPSFSAQPQSKVVPLDAAVSFSVVASGQPAPAIQWKKNGIDIAGATGPTLSLPRVTSSDFGFYQAIATNAAGSAASTVAKLSRTLSSTLPTFTTQPESRTASALSTVTFTAAAAGAPEPAYQWHKNGNAITGATAAALVLPGITTNDRGLYHVVATNAAGSVSSDVVTLGVLQAPVFTLHPASRTVDAATAVTLSAAASGDPAPAYQWRKDGENLSGATASTLTLPFLTPADAGSYSVVATNSAGNSTSNAAMIMVIGSSPPAPQETATGAKTIIYAMTPLSGTPHQTTFTVGGSTPRRMLVRAVGPSLRTLGVTDVLENPVLELYQGDRLRLLNDNWKGSSVLSAAFAEAGTFPYSSAFSADAAFVLTLDPGTYGLKVYGNPSSIGVTLIEVYELP